MNARVALGLVMAGWLSACSAPVPQGEPLVIAAVGDIMMGSSWPDEQTLPPDDGAGMFAEVTPILSLADVTFGNLEGPLIDGGRTTKCSPRSVRCIAFRTPSRYARHLKAAGFDVMSLANNHALDFGTFGRDRTMRALNQQGIAHSGARRDIAHLTVKGRTLHVVAFAPYDAFNDLLDLKAAKRLVSELASKGDLVVVSFHGGAEGIEHQRVPTGSERFLDEDRGNLRRFARAMVDAGADLVLGHGPHVVRGMEVYRDRLIAYSLGYFATYGLFDLSSSAGLSLILEVRLAPDGAFAGGVVHPIRQEEPGGPRLDPNREILPVLKTLSIEDFGRRAVAVGEDGTLAAP